jgi:CTD small phosphatase-like protein 2
MDDENDDALAELAPLLQEIAMRKVKDVREALKIFRNQMMEQIAAGISNPQLSLEKYDC